MTALRKDKAIMLLGHGSKAPEANETLRRVAKAVGSKGGYGLVLPAFLQMEKPDFQEAAGQLVAKGFMDITVMPYFLYMGLHVTQDLPSEIEEAKKRHPGLKIGLKKNLGYHESLVDITIERIEEGGAKSEQRPFAQHPIERESFRILSEELGAAHFQGIELPVVKRVIHSTADFEFKDIIRFSPGAVEAGINAICAGADIITDVKMIEAGIGKARLEPFGASVRCFSSDKDVAELSASEGITKTAASMRKAAPFLDGAIVAIGNAPTALSELINISKISKNGPRPALVVGVPVGFVGAVESKEELEKSGLEYILTSGRKGGSTVAVAIVNALALLAGESLAQK